MDSQDFRRAQVFAAWILLAAAAVEVGLGAWTLSGQPGGPAAGSPFLLPNGSPIGLDFWLRGEEALPDLLQITVTALPVAAALLAAMTGRPDRAARQIMFTALTIQILALAIGVVVWIAILSKAAPWQNISWAVDIAVALAGLVLTSALLRSRGADPASRPRANARRR